MILRRALWTFGAGSAIADSGIADTGMSPDVLSRRRWKMASFTGSGSSIT